MKTTMMAGVCLLALVLIFTIAECGPSQEKRQTSCDEALKNCIAICEQAADAGGNDAALTQCKESCETAHDVCSGGEGSGGATTIAGATIVSTISALLVAVASAMN